MAPKPRPWFRFYVEAIHDRKLRRLKVEHRWLWVVILAAARQSCIPGWLLISEREPLAADDLADMAALPLRQVQQGLKAIEEAGMIEVDRDLRAWRVPAWDRRQYESDRSTDRTAQWRREHPPSNGDVTAYRTAKERPSNVDVTAIVTPPENREQRTETEKVKPTVNGSTHRAVSARNDSAPDGAGVSFQRFWDAYPRKQARQDAEKAWTKAVTKGHADPALLRERLASQIQVWEAEGRPVDKYPYAATWLNGRRWEDEVLTQPISSGERYR